MMPGACFRSFVFSFACLVGSTFLFSSCASLNQSTYERPQLSFAPNWYGSASKGMLSALPSWWVAFGDPALNHLVDKAMKANRDLATAVLSLRQAKLQVDIAREQGYPTLAAGISSSVSRSFKAPKTTTHEAGTSLSVSWQLDLWGNIADQVDAAEWEARATDQDRFAVAMTVSSEVADDYWQLALIADQIDLNRKTIEYDEQTLRLVQCRHDIGVATAIDILAAKQTLSAAERNRSELENELVQTSNSLSILVGDPVGTAYSVEARVLNQTPPDIPVGVPADILSRRPDVKAAELRLRESLRDVDVTRTSFYPTLGLTGAGGTSSEALRNLLQNPAGSIVASIAFPFLDAWTMNSQIASSRISYDEQVVAFKRSFYQALVDVENALSSVGDYNAQIVQLQQAVEYANESKHAYAMQYEVGTVPLQTLLDADEAAHNAVSSLSSARYRLVVSEVALMVALGGTVDLPQ
ncbi:efflux transporter outer membrane subunit [Paraburkholderia sp. Ac-20347]|uniref:efflux transporter outer membrane subunit n=1 Tax=Paraburkholderia sp. Ac-20347 TaxID=2703892 RepID=UPI00197E693D|nr:efflux transporter outer membrane subunit [Paraburkholderia sp. Ac-20347]MBN3812791.1 efflux transporter outer membrane subunit [Paraburkholderia sp. Ac-20347]